MFSELYSIITIIIIIVIIIILFTQQYNSMHTFINTTEKNRQRGPTRRLTKSTVHL